MSWIPLVEHRAAWTRSAGTVRVEMHLRGKEVCVWWHAVGKVHWHCMLAISRKQLTAIGTLLLWSAEVRRSHLGWHKASWALEHHAWHTTLHLLRHTRLVAVELHEVWRDSHHGRLSMRCVWGAGIIVKVARATRIRRHAKVHWWAGKGDT